MNTSSIDAVSAFERARTGLWLCWLISCGLLTGCSTATPLPALDAEYGFKGLKFETDTSAVSGLRPIWWESVTQDIAAPNTTTHHFIRPTDTLTAWGYPVQRIAYSFYKGELSCVFVTVKGEKTFDHIVEAMQAIYGKGEGTLGLEASERLWIGQKVEIDTRHFDGGLPDYYVPEKEIYTFNIASLVVRHRIEEDEQLILASDSLKATSDRSK